MRIIKEDIALRVGLAVLNLEPRTKRILRRIKRIESGALTTREKMEIEKRKRDQYFKKALFNLDTEPFFRKWLLQSRKSMPQVLDFLASSFGTVEGFELANRAMRENLNMGEAGVDLDIIEEFSKKSSRIAFFEFVLLKNNVSPRWANLAMALFVAKEFGMEKTAGEPLVNKHILEALKVISRKKPEGPFPNKRPARAPAKAAAKAPAKRVVRKKYEEDIDEDEEN